jgi:hypothetical protein
VEIQKKQVIGADQIQADAAGRQRQQQHLGLAVGVVEVVDDRHSLVDGNRPVQTVKRDPVVFDVLGDQLQQTGPLRDHDRFVLTRYFFFQQGEQSLNLQRELSSCFYGDTITLLLRRSLWKTGFDACRKPLDASFRPTLSSLATTCPSLSSMLSLFSCSKRFNSSVCSWSSASPRSSSPCSICLISEGWQQICLSRSSRTRISCWLTSFTRFSFNSRFLILKYSPFGSAATNQSEGLRFWRVHSRGAPVNFISYASWFFAARWCKNCANSVLEKISTFW